MAGDQDRADVPQVGDWAYHVTKDLDERQVTRVEQSHDGRWLVWLMLITSEAGPFPADQYTFERDEEG